METLQISKGYRTELDPNNIQRTILFQHAGTARWAYNWGLAKKKKAYRDNLDYPTAIDLHKDLCILKNLPEEEGGVPWMYNSSKCIPQEALRNLDNAFNRFFSNCKKGEKKKGFPKFKSKRKRIGGFKLYGAIHVEENRIKLPKLGWIRLKETGYLPVKDVQILFATVKEKVGV